VTVQKITCIAATATNADKAHQNALPSFRIKSTRIRVAMIARGAE
jgi:hypothetical protein